MDTLGTLAGVHVLQGVLLIQVLLNCKTIVNLYYLYNFISPPLFNLIIDVLYGKRFATGRSITLNYLENTLFKANSSAI